MNPNDLHTAAAESAKPMLDSTIWATVISMASGAFTGLLYLIRSGDNMRIAAMEKRHEAMEITMKADKALVDEKFALTERADRARWERLYEDIGDIKSFMAKMSGQQDRNDHSKGRG